LEILIPIETWNEIDFSLWIKSQNWNETEIAEECCEVIKDLKLFPKTLLKDQKMEGKTLKEFLISEILGNVLIWKCKNGLIDNISWYLDGPFKNIVNINFGIESPFFIACKEGNIEIVELLLNYERVDFNKVNEYGQTPFFIACQEGSEVVELLLNDERVNINQVDHNNESPFYAACYYGNIEVVLLLLSDDRIDGNDQDNNGTTSFNIACQEGHFEIVELLLNDQRVDVNKPNNDGKVPFYSACENGHLEIVELLLNDQRIDINKENNIGSTPFFIACKNGQIEVIKLLLVDERIDINQANKYGMDALWISASNGHINIVEYLLNSGKTFNLKSKWDVDISNNQANHKTVIEQVKYQISPEKIKFSWETYEILQKVIKNGPSILKLLEQYIQKDEIILTGEFLKLGKGVLKQWQSRVFDLKLQSLAWKKYQNVNIFSFIFKKKFNTKINNRESM